MNILKLLLDCDERILTCKFSMILVNNEFDTKLVAKDVAADHQLTGSSAVRLA